MITKRAKEAWLDSKAIIDQLNLPQEVCRSLKRNLDSLWSEIRRLESEKKGESRYDYDEPAPGTIGALGRERSRGGEDMGW